MLSRKETYEEVLDIGEQIGGWWGKQVYKELNHAAISYTLQRNLNEYPFLKPLGRVLNHLLIYSPPGFLKSTLINSWRSLIGNLGIPISTTTTEALRGTVNLQNIGKGTVVGSFVPPVPCQTSAIFVDEWNTIAHSRDRSLHPLILQLLELEEVSVFISKLEYLTSQQRMNIEGEYKDHNLIFDTAQSFRYKPDSLWIIATYDLTPLTDEAFLQRVNTVLPEREFDDTWNTKIASIEHPPVVSEDLKDSLRYYIKKSVPNINETDYNKYKQMALELFPKIFNTPQGWNPRLTRDVNSFIATQLAWELDLNEEIITNFITTRSSVLKSVDLKKNALIESGRNPSSWEGYNKKFAITFKDREFTIKEAAQAVSGSYFYIAGVLSQQPEVYKRVNPGRKPVKYVIQQNAVNQAHE